VLRAGGEGGLLRALDGRGLRLPMSTAIRPPAAEAVWHELHDRLRRFIARRVRSPQDAEDILQEVMLRIHRHSGDLEHADRVASWVYRIAANSIADHYRRPARRELALGQAMDIAERAGAAAATAWAEPDSAELRAELAHCLAPLTARLPDLYREALDVTEFQGITQTEAAGRLGLSVSGMKARVQRGREQLKDLLLDCCEVELDRRGGVTAYRSKRGSCGTCGRR
jgi:RNA polymerase sigma-70 factor, ECF subfamily